MTKSLLGVDTDDKTWILNDSGVVDKFLVGHNVLHKPFWINQKYKIRVGPRSKSRSAGSCLW